MSKTKSPPPHMQYTVIGKCRVNHLEFYLKPKNTTQLEANDLVMLSGVIFQAVGGFLPPYRLYSLSSIITLDDIKRQHDQDWSKRIYLPSAGEWVSVTELVDAYFVGSNLAEIVASLQAVENGQA